MNIIKKLLSLVDPVANDLYQHDRYKNQWTGKERMIKKDWKMIDGWHMSRVIKGGVKK